MSLSSQAARNKDDFYYFSFILLSYADAKMIHFFENTKFFHKNPHNLHRLWGIDDEKLRLLFLTKILLFCYADCKINDFSWKHQIFREKKIISPYEVPYDKSTTMIMPFINDLPSLTITLDIFRQVNVRNYFYILTWVRRMSFCCRITLI